MIKGTIKLFNHHERLLREERYTSLEDRQRIVSNWWSFYKKKMELYTFQIEPYTDERLIDGKGGNMRNKPEYSNKRSLYGINDLP